ncbi:hypothetical protein SGPA1_31535 [Streptomyces misionensis JCM 4497]
MRGGGGVRHRPDRRQVLTARPHPTAHPEGPRAPVARRGLRRARTVARCGHRHTPAGQRQVDGRSGHVVDFPGHVRRQKRKPVRIRRGPATVTGVNTPGARNSRRPFFFVPGRGHPE